MKIEDIDREFRELARLLKEAETAFRSTRYREAEDLYRRALDLNQHTYGEENEDTIRCLSNLGDIYYSLKEYQKAIPVFGRLLVVKERTIGPNHGDVATILFKLARTYHKLGKAADAEPLYRRALSIADTAYGSTSSITSTIAESFATLLRSTQSRTGELERLEERLKTRMVDPRRITGHQTGGMTTPASLRDPGQSNTSGNLGQARSTHANLGPLKPTSGGAQHNNHNDGLSGAHSPTQPGSVTGEHVLDDTLVESGRMKPIRPAPISVSAGRGSVESVKKTTNLLVPAIALVSVAALAGGAYMMKLLPLSSSTGTNQSATNEKLTGSAGGFFNSMQNMFTHAPSTNSNGSVTGSTPLLDIGKYLSPDLKRRLELHVNGDMTVLKDGIKQTGKYTTDGTSIVFKPESGTTNISYKISAHALQEDDGTTLYGKDAPEAIVLTIMNRLASYSNRYYSDVGSYPHDMEQLHLVIRNLMYRNPVTGAQMEPIRMQITGADSKAADMDMSTYSALVTQIKSLSVWNPQQHQPCVVEYFRTANTSDGECFYIKATDRNGQYFKASAPNTAVVLNLVQGKTRNN